MKIVIGYPKLINKKLCKNPEYFKNLGVIINRIKEELTKLEIEVVQPKQIEGNDICNSLWFRDNFINVDNKLYFLHKTTSKERKPIKELNTVKEFNAMKDTRVKNGIIVENYFIDGGDIIQHNDVILVGLSDRTEKKAVEWFKSEFKNKEIIQIKHHSLHLDCCLCVLPNNVIVYSKKYVKSFPSKLRKKYKVYCLEDFMKKGEETNLGTNLLIVGKNIITIDIKKFYKFYDFLKTQGFNVILIPFFDLWKDKGGIRCLTQWIDKGNQIVV